MRFQDNILKDINVVKEFKILITGASGFIGSRLLNDLIDTKRNENSSYSIRCLTRDKSVLDYQQIRKLEKSG